MKNSIVKTSYGLKNSSHTRQYKPQKVNKHAHVFIKTGFFLLFYLLKSTYSRK